MNTPAHVLIGATAFGRGNRPRVLIASVLGSIAPDLSLYLLAGTSLYLLSIPPQVVFDELYFSPEWQAVFAIDNSVFVWGLFLGIAYWLGRAGWMAFAASALLHIALDFPLHAGDGRPHFWPISDWEFDSPVSYWDSTHHAGWVTPISILISVTCCVLLWRSIRNWGWRAFFMLMLAAEIWTARQWVLFF